MFAVVDFVETHQVAAASSSWIQGNICYWPPHPTDALLEKAISTHQQPDVQNWQAYLARILKKCDTFQNAKQHVPAAENGESDLSDGVSLKHRKRKRTPKVYSGCSPPCLTKKSKTAIQSHLQSNVGQSQPENIASEPVDEVGSDTVANNRFSPSCITDELVQRNQEPINETPLRYEQYMEPETHGFETHDASLHEVFNVVRSPQSPILEPTTPTTSARSSLFTARHRNIHALNSDPTFQIYQSVFQNHVIDALKGINVRLANMESRFGNNDSQDLLTENVDSQPSDFPDLPIGSVAALEELDQNVKQNLDIRKYLVTRLATVGGKTPDEAIQRMLGRLFTDEVGECYSWKGKTKKLNFSLLTFHNVIFEALSKNREFRKTATEKTVEIKISNRLKYAPTRVK